MLWHRRSVHINVSGVTKLAEEKSTGTVVKDNNSSTLKRDICAVAKIKQQNHPKVAGIQVTQPLDLVYTDLSGPSSPAYGAGNTYVAKFTYHHTRVKSVYCLRKKNQAIDALPKPW